MAENAYALAEHYLKPCKIVIYNAIALRKWADYALMESGRPIAVIEAKALGKPLDEKETMQALNYANTAGIPYMTLTNGDHWRTDQPFTGF